MDDYDIKIMKNLGSKFLNFTKSLYLHPTYSRINDERNFDLNNSKDKAQEKINELVENAEDCDSLELIMENKLLNKIPNLLNSEVKEPKEVAVLKNRYNIIKIGAGILYTSILDGFIGLSIIAGTRILFDWDHADTISKEYFSSFAWRSILFPFVTNSGSAIYEYLRGEKIKLKYESIKNYQDFEKRILDD